MCTASSVTTVLLFSGHAGLGAASLLATLDIYTKYRVNNYYDDRFGSQAVLFTNTTRTAASGGKAAVPNWSIFETVGTIPGMSAFLQSGRSKGRN